MNLTQKEQNYLKDALEMENLFLTKCSVYADQCQDQRMKSMMFDMATTRREHANQLKGLLGRSGGGKYNPQYQ